MPFMSKELRGGKELEGKGGEINIFPRNLFTKLPSSRAQALIFEN